MDLIQVDDAGHLFISPVIHDWSVLAAKKIDTVFDLEGDLDIGVPTVPNHYLYIYFPIADDGLPSLTKLHALASTGANLIADGHRVLSHCGMGYNRSALLAGVILHRMGMSGPQAVQRLQERRPGALFNPLFEEYLQGL